MQEPSIRSFTLDYYRSLGAELTPLDAQARRWEVRWPQRHLSITFDHASETAGEVEERPITPVSAHWRAILEECTREQTVSYRHVVSRPIDQPAQLFEPILPGGFRVESARLIEVLPRTAIAFSHRVTYEAPAMSARDEELHLDAIDPETGDRLDILSEACFSFLTIPVDPPQTPALSLEKLHERALSWLDARTEAKGAELERQMSPRLEEALARVRSHVAGQVADILRAEERALIAKLEDLVRRKGETRLPAAMAKLEEEAERLVIEIEHLHVRRELEADGLRRDESARLDAERERHEVTVNTCLVGVCQVTYDEVRYELTLSRGTEHGRLTIAYLPTTGELFLPSCPQCGQSIRQPGFLDNGQACCHRCAARHLAASAGAPEAPATTACDRCGTETPESLVQRCHLTATPYCVACALDCVECGKVTRRNLLRPSPSGRGMVCPDHLITCATCHQGALPRETFVCPICEERHCLAEADHCPSCAMPACRRCSRVVLGHCLACTQLTRVRADHPHVAIILSQYPDLARKRLSWRWSKAGEFALIEWRSLSGAWGRFILNTQDHLLLSQSRMGAVAHLSHRLMAYFGWGNES
jgi:hypothetical protein